MEQLAEVGIDMEKVTADLLAAGVKSFSDFYDELIRGIAEKVDAMRGGYGSRQHLNLAASTDVVRDALSTDAPREVARRIWDRDADLWKPGDAAHAKVIGNRLGWLDVVDTMRGELPRLIGLTDRGAAGRVPQLRAARHGRQQPLPGGVAHLVRQRRGPARAARARHHRSRDHRRPHRPARPAHHAVHRRLEVRHDAGDAQPPRSFLGMDHHRGRPRGRRALHLHHRPRLAACATPRASASSATSSRTRPTSVAATRRSASSGWCRRRSSASTSRPSSTAPSGCACSAAPGTPADLNPGLALGTVLGLLQRSGRDKVTILAPTRIAAFSLWAEQLIAESTGKEGKGLIPIGDEPIGEPGVYGDDRILTVLRLRDEDREFDAEVGALRSAGIPDVTMQLDDLLDLAAEFFALGVRDGRRRRGARASTRSTSPTSRSRRTTPGVSSTSTSRAAASPTSRRRRATTASRCSAPRDAGTSTAPSPSSSPRCGRATTSRSWPTSRPTPRTSRRCSGCAWPSATSTGWPPRSASARASCTAPGSCTRAVPASGLYIQITADDAVDVPIPGQPFSFSILKQAQAQGDLQSLRDHERRVIRLHIGGDLALGLSRLTDSVIHAATGAR